jgi:DNA (cytosine-5)-methyltransferase 1
VNGRGLPPDGTADVREAPTGRGGRPVARVVGGGDARADRGRRGPRSQDGDDRPRVVSTFSGVGGLDLGLHQAGWRHELLCERDEYRRAVLATRFPGVPILDDVRSVGVPSERRRTEQDSADIGVRPEYRPRREGGRPDLLCGGFPCQDLSVAGRRAGLAGERSGLFFEFARIAESVRPRWLLIENVPGLLTSNGGRDFGELLGTLADVGYGVAWRVLDSRHFGVPQRRRRVFILACDVGGRAGAERAGEVLAVGQGCDRHLAAGGEARPGTADGVGERAAESGVVNALDRQAGGPDDNSAQAGHLVPLLAHTLTVKATANGTAHSPDECTYLPAPSGVRRLTPRECERLQGFPDDWTLIPWAGKPAPDSRRYAALGDAVAVPVARWLGERIMAHIAMEVAA